MKTRTITSNKIATAIAMAIDEGKVQWQVHTLYNRMGLETDNIREAASMTSVGTVTISNLKCPKCKHDAHKAGDCDTRICDAAGDIDYCPCQMGAEK